MPARAGRITSKPITACSTKDVEFLEERANFPDPVDIGQVWIAYNLTVAVQSPGATIPSTVSLPSFLLHAARQQEDWRRKPSRMTDGTNTIAALQPEEDWTKMRE